MSGALARLASPPAAILAPLLLAVALAPLGCSAAAVVAETTEPVIPTRSSMTSTTTITTPGTTTTSSTTTTTVTTTDTAPGTVPSPRSAAPPAARWADRVLIVGDSVLLGARSALPAALPGWRVTLDAAESRNISAFTGVLASAGGPAPFRVVVVHLCTNYSKGGGFSRSLDRAMAALAGVPRVVWVTCTEWSAGPPEANAAIRAAPERYGNVVVADWAVISGTAGFTWADGIHLRPEGQRAASALVASATGPP